ncbi:hypothetical protein MHK_000858 [Candidatus Magnetomorum sp. HK-1]|nr:hypothetical protein MHK_000858 [Candidatus Magnetomorum sp. HK-1]
MKKIQKRSNHSDEQKMPSIIKEKLNALRQKRKELIGLSPEDALDQILSYNQSTALVHSIPTQDLLMLIHEIGTDDALPLLSLASTNQWQYMVDVQIWKRDRLCITETTRWLHLLMKADPNRFMNWFLNEDPKYFYYYLYQNLDIIALQENEDFSDLPDTFFSMDSVYYTSLSDSRLEQSLDRETEELREEFVTEFLKRLAACDHYEYQKILVNISSVIPAEFEEESFRLKNIRLEMNGFLPFEEAIGIYQFISEKDFLQLKPVISDKPQERSQVNIPEYPIQTMSHDNYFSKAIMAMESDTQIAEVHLQFVSLCNQIISADTVSVTSKDILKDVVNKACGYIHISIESLLANTPQNSKNLVNIVTKYSVKHLFQLGYSKILSVKWKADSWYRHSFINESGLPLDFWDEEWLGFLGGLLLKRPRFYAAFEDGVLYREFKSMDEIQKVENILTQIIALDEMLSFFSVKIHPIEGYQLTYKNMLLTLFARDLLQLKHLLAPIPVAQFQKFFDAMWEPNLEIPNRRIQRSLKQSFIEWFTNQTRFETEYIQSRFGSIFDQLFNDILSELGNIACKDLSPRYINSFLLE